MAGTATAQHMAVETAGHEDKAFTLENLNFLTSSVGML